MFSKLAVLSSIALLVAANPPVTTTVTVTAPPSGPPPPSTECSPGPVQCCNSDNLISSGTFIGGLIIELLGILLSGPDVLLGLDCSPLSIIGVPSAECNGEAVCCENNDFAGLGVVIGCSPVNIFA